MNKFYFTIAMMTLFLFACALALVGYWLFIPDSANMFK